MLVIQRRGSSLVGMGRYYQCSGMFDTIARKLFSSGIKKVISNGTSSAIAHKVADAVVNGATSSTLKKVTDAIVKEATSAAGKASAGAVKTAIDSVVNKMVRGVKRSAADAVESSIIVHQQPSSKRKKINIDSLIDGSGIIYA